MAQCAAVGVQVSAVVRLDQVEGALVEQFEQARGGADAERMFLATPRPADLRCIDVGDADFLAVGLSDAWPRPHLNDASNSSAAPGAMTLSRS